MAESALTQLKPLRDYREQIPGHRKDTRCHLSTLIRWATVGVKTPAVGLVRLRAVRAGSKWLTCDEWFQEFITTLTEARIPGSTSSPHATPAARRSAATRAGAALEKLGA
jgi:hypothetical protein